MTRTSIAFFALLLLALTPFGAQANGWVATVHGMDCPVCDDGIKDKLKKDPTVGKVTLSYPHQTVTVISKPGQTIPKKTITDAVSYMSHDLVKLREIK